MPISLFRRKTEEPAPAAAPRRRPAPRPPAAESYEPAEPVTLTDDPLRRFLEQGRYGIVLAHGEAWAGQPGIEEVCRAATAAIDDRFALVPEGFAALPQTVDDHPGCPEIDVPVEPFLLALDPVTHAEFQLFVDAGGYQNLELWPEDIWPHIIDFRDLTGRPGPRYWREGRHDRRLADHPVVGVCFYEAQAYVRWAGYRLPDEAEWQMAASWRIRSSANTLRRYPWGDALDTTRCNIWASGVGRTVPVTEYESGAAPNGVRQLIGNVWEWTASDFSVVDAEGNPVVGDMLMKSIRGGAFDTYFPAQATSCFRTGLAALARTHNVGFRAALDLGGR